MINKLKYFFNHILLRKPVLIIPSMENTFVEDKLFPSGIEHDVGYIRRRIQTRQAAFGVRVWIYENTIHKAPSPCILDPGDQLYFFPGQNVSGIELEISKIDD